MSLYIGIDLGTSALKLLLVDGSGAVVNTVSRAYPLYFPHSGWSEQQPEDWWSACVDGIPALLKGSDYLRKPAIHDRLTCAAVVLHSGSWPLASVIDSVVVTIGRWIS